MRKLLVIAIGVFLLTLIIAPRVYAAQRVLPRYRRAQVQTQGVLVLVKFRTDRKAVTMTINNVKKASSIEYVLSYTTGGVEQGSKGTLNIAASANQEVRELLFGTCSKGVCRYDAGITNAKLVVTTVMPGSKKYIKTFILKV